MAKRKDIKKGLMGVRWLCRTGARTGFHSIYVYKQGCRFVRDVHRHDDAGSHAALDCKIHRLYHPDEVLYEEVLCIAS